MSRFALRGFDGSGAFELPDYDSATCSFEFSDIGALDLSYSVSGTNASRLADNVEVALLLDGVELDNGRWLVRGIGGDEAVEGAASYKFSGRSILSVFEGVVVLGATPATPTPVGFVSKSAGEIIRTLITQAQARGALTGITMGTFSNTLDSNSSAWTTTYTVTYNVGVKYIDILRELVSKGLIELKMVGADLRVYKPDTMGTDTTNGATPVTLRTGIDFKDAPFTRSVDNYASDAIVEGDNATYVRRQRTSTHPYGRQEVFISQSGTADSGALTIVGDSALDSFNRARIEKTRSMVVTSATQFHPLVDFKVSDYIFQVAGAPTAVVSPEKVRVRMISVGLDTSGIDTASLVLNDKFMDQEILAARQIDALMGGAISTSTGGPATSSDTTVPAQPAAPAVTSVVYTLNDGTPSAVVTVTANTPALNVDGSAFSDLASYAVRWRYADANVPPNPGAWQNVQGSSTTTIAFSAVRVGVTIEVQTAVFDQAGHISAWSASTAHATATDSTPPPVPTTPVAVEYIGSVKVTWDGQFAGAAPKPTDFRHVEVHLGLTSGFTPDDTTMVGILSGAGSLNVPALSYGTTYWAKMRSVDSYGNKSAATSADSAIPYQATTGDIAPSVIADVTSDPVFVQYFGSDSQKSGWVQGDVAAWDLIKKSASGAEDGTVAGWIGVGATPPTITNSTVRAYAGTRSFRATWGTTSAFAGAGLATGWKTNRPFVPGKSYTATVRAYVPTGSPSVAITIAGYGTGTTMSTKDAWTLMTMTWTATASDNGLQLSAVGSTTAGQYVDYDDVHIYCNDDLVTWYNDTGAPTVPGVLRVQGRCLAEWQASTPMPYDPKALYRVHGRIRINHVNRWTNGDFASGSTGWDTFWSGGSLTWAFSSTAKATYTAGGAAQTAVLTQPAAINSVAPAGTTIRIAGRYRCTDPGADPRVEPLFAPTGGDAQYFGSGSIIGSGLILDPGVGATWTNFSVDVVIPSGYSLYTMYMRCNNITAAGGYIEWDDLSLKELSTTTDVGFIGYKADRTTPICPDNTTTTKESIHSVYTVDGSQVDDNGWVEFTGYVSDRSDAAGSRAGLSWNQRTFEYGTVENWLTSANSTLAAAAAAADGSAYGLQLTSIAAGTVWAETVNQPIVNDGIAPVSASMRVKGSAALSIYAHISWADSDGVYISTTSGTTATLSTTAFNDIAVSAIPPAGAAYARVGFIATATAASQLVYMDDLNVTEPWMNGATAQTAIALANQAAYWRPAIFFDPKSIADDTLDVDWFQVDRVQSDISIPGSILAPQISTGQLVVDNVFIDSGLVYNTPNAVDGYVLTAQGPDGNADWEILPPPAKVSSDGSAPAGLRAGDLWVNPLAVGDAPSFISVSGPSTARNLALGTTYTKISEFGGTRLTIPCDGVLTIDFYCWIGWAAAPTAGAYSLGYINVVPDTTTATLVGDGLADYWYIVAWAAIARQQIAKVSKTVSFTNVPPEGVGLNLEIWGYGATSQASASYPRYRLAFYPNAAMSSLTIA